jgi:cytochrome c
VYRFIGILALAIASAFVIAGFLPEPSTGVAVGNTATPAPTQALPEAGSEDEPGKPAAGMSNPEMPDMFDRLAQPTLPAHPNQADLGGQVYYFVCMACHGDQGQGLSPEWVAAWELGDQTCWSSKCHASNHPQEGFELPKFIPAVVSPSVVYRFETALDLHDYLQEKMPWHAPGSLKEEEYWQLTAYLVRENGIDSGQAPLDAARASAIRMRPLPESARRSKVALISPWWLAAAITISGLLLLLVKYPFKFRNR